MPLIAVSLTVAEVVCRLHHHCVYRLKSLQLGLHLNQNSRRFDIHHYQLGNILHSQRVLLSLLDKGSIFREKTF